MEYKPTTAPAAQTQGFVQPQHPQVVPAAPYQQQNFNNNQYAQNVQAHPVVPDVDESLQRRRWHRITIAVILVSIGFIYVGAMNIAGKNNGNPGSCCLPRGCDVSKLRNSDNTAWKSNVNGDFCEFTDDELLLMGCPSNYKETRQMCTLSPIPSKKGKVKDDHMHVCHHNDAVGKMVGSGIPLIVMGGVSILTALCFFLPGYTCFGALGARKTCCNWTARLFTGSLWGLVFSGAICGIVFGSLLTYRLNHPFDTQETCNRHNGETQCDSHDHYGLYWTGASCPESIKNTPADVFSWISPTHWQKIHAHVTIVLSVAFIVFTMAAIVRCIIRCCKRCNNSHQSYNAAAPGTNYVAVGQPQAQSQQYGQPMVYAQPQQPQQPFAAAANAGPYYGTSEQTPAQGQVLAQEQQPINTTVPEYPTKPQQQA